MMKLSLFFSVTRPENFKKPSATGQSVYCKTRRQARWRKTSFVLKSVTAMKFTVLERSPAVHFVCHLRYEFRIKNRK